LVAERHGRAGNAPITRREIQRAVEAAVRASKGIAPRAPLIDPVVNSAFAAIKLADELWG
jgi:hypothetical protein